ncbi:MAG: hypothetical protein JJE21_02170 [Spirochaetaceae bacterium]|nr:hypothetical protein [Spirochaetaceae bacterium]
MESYKIFMVMPFDIELNELYQHIKSLIEQEDVCFKVFRADDLINNQSILKDVVVSIYESDLIIADLTGLNANVFYELGLAHAFRKNVVLLTQDISELPFDLRSYRVIEYNTNFSKIEKLGESLKKILNEIKSNIALFGNPVTDYVDNIHEKSATKNIFIQTEDKPDTIPVDIVEDMGMLDYIADIEDSMLKINDVVNEFVIKTTEMAEDITLKSAGIESAWKNPSTGTASHVRKLMRKVAQPMTNYGDFLCKTNKNYDSLWIIFEDSISNLVISPLFKNNSENINEFSTFLTVLEELKASIIPAIIGLNSMVSVVISLKGMESSITRAASLIELESKAFVGLLNKSVSTLDRIVLIGKTQSPLLI